MAKQAQASKSTAPAFSVDLVSFVEHVAESNADVKKSLDLAVKAGAVFGATVHTSDATATLKALGDSVAAAVGDMQAKPDDAEPAQAFRLLCGMVNCAIKSAQSAAKRLAVTECKAAQMADYAKNARNRIRTALDRHMAVYGLKIDWQAVTFSSVETPEEDTDADKAAKAIARAFKLDGAAAVKALGELELHTMVHIVAMLGERVAIERRRQLESDLEHKVVAAKALREAAHAVTADPAELSETIAVARKAAATATREARKAAAMLKAAA